MQLKSKKMYILKDELKQNYPILKIRQSYLFLLNMIRKHLSCNLFILWLS